MHLLYSMVVLSVVKLLTATESVNDPSDEVVENGVEFFLNTKKTMTEFDTKDIRQSILTAPLAEGSDKVVFVIHGYSETHKSKSMEAIRSAYMEKEDRNVIMVDYSKIANTANGYVKSVCALGEISKSIANVVELLKRLREEITNYHLIGFSMGAHVACKVGKILNAKDMKLDRVTALDAAEPLFGGLRNEVNPTCAHFVDALHTNIHTLGISEPIGTADTYVNDGQNQPECYQKIGLIDFCNHITAVFLYAATITDSDKYKATYCLDYIKNPDINDNCASLYNQYSQEDFKAIAVICSVNDNTTRTVAVGENMPLDSKGVYQLQLKDSLTGL